jgi:hypothetical protein
VPLELLFQYPTVASLAAAIDAARSQSGGQARMEETDLAAEAVGALPAFAVPPGGARRKQVAQCRDEGRAALTRNRVLGRRTFGPCS